MHKSVLIVAMLMLSGCATWSTSNVEKNDNAQVTSPKVSETSGMKQKTLQDIHLVETDITEHEYTILGDIEVTVNKTTIFHSDPTREQVNEKLREEALKLGADAVIFVRYGTGGISLMSWGALNGKGRAIAFLD